MERLKQDRTLSFVFLTLIYLLATAIGIWLYKVVDLPWWLGLLVADVVATLVTFVFSLVLQNASVYDPYWSVQPPVILFAFAIGRRLTALGILLLVAVSFWAVRLTANWAYTFHGLHKQDWRYTMLREKTGAFYPLINLVGIHMVPTLVVYGCILPAVYSVTEGMTANPVSILCLCLSLGAATMQGVADVQMHAFRKNPTATFIRYGLWKHSRHPNYLGEILMWWGVGLAVLVAAPDAWYLLAGAVANTLLFLCVSIPLADGRQSRKAGFDTYRSQTRMLLPIPKFR